MWQEQGEPAWARDGYINHSVSGSLLYSNPKGLGQSVMSQSTDPLCKILELPLCWALVLS